MAIPLSLTCPRKPYSSVSCMCSCYTCVAIKQGLSWWLLCSPVSYNIATLSCESYEGSRQSITTGSGFLRESRAHNLLEYLTWSWRLNLPLLWEKPIKYISSTKCTVCVRTLSPSALQHEYLATQFNASDASNMLALPPLATYPSKEALFEAIQSWSKSHGYAFITQRSKRLGSGLQRVQYACDRWDHRSLDTSNTQRTRETQTRGTGCLFSILGIESSLGWEVRYRLGTQFNTHNHPPSLSSAAHPSHRHLSIQVQTTSQNLFSAG
jgi:hypothetical protein